jgi:predicted nucleic acid-binding protein
LSSILVDTSFLITLADPARRHHEVAKTYFRECLKANAPLYLSAIAASEFQVKQAVNDLPIPIPATSSCCRSISTKR